MSMPAPLCNACISSTTASATASKSSPRNGEARWPVVSSGPGPGLGLGVVTRRAEDPGFFLPLLGASEPETVPKHP
jgi:hypothetical protein